jgi:hypothetical protein
MPRLRKIVFSFSTPFADELADRAVLPSSVLPMHGSGEIQTADSSNKQFGYLRIFSFFTPSLRPRLLTSVSEHNCGKGGEPTNSTLQMA